MEAGLVEIVLSVTEADPGGQSGHGPPSKLAMEFAPLEGRKSNDSTVNLWKSKGFGPLSMSASDLAPLRKKTILTPGKGRRLKKKVTRNSGREMDIFWGEWQKF